jgi:hypothetical protein
MAAAKRTKHETIRDRAEISELYLRGKTQAQIAELLSKDPARAHYGGLSQQTISRDLRVIQKEWAEAAQHNMTELKAKELAKIDNLERMYLDEWYRSKGESIETEQEQDETTGKSRKKAKVKKKSQLGDAKYLQGVQWCIGKRCEIFGLDAPKELDIKDQRLVDKIPWDSLTKDQIRRLQIGENPEKVIPGFKLN